MADRVHASDVAAAGLHQEGHNTIRRIAVFCGASSGNRPEYAECARKLGREMVKRGIGLVYGGAPCTSISAALHQCEKVISSMTVLPLAPAMTSS